MLVWPSPKSQAYVVISPEDRSSKLTSSGAIPERGMPTNSALMRSSTTVIEPLTMIAIGVPLFNWTFSISSGEVVPMTAFAETCSSRKKKTPSPLIFAFAVAAPMSNWPSFSPPPGTVRVLTATIQLSANEPERLTLISLIATTLASKRTSILLDRTSSPASNRLTETGTRTISPRAASTLGKLICTA